MNISLNLFYSVEEVETYDIDLKALKEWCDDSNISLDTLTTDDIYEFICLHNCKKIDTHEKDCYLEAVSNDELLVNEIVNCMSNED